MFGYIVATIIILGLLIFVHELGHFLVARLAGIRVLEFAMGFGKELLGWEKDGTRYTLRAFPLGGFCRMLGEDEEETDEEGSFQHKPVSWRFAVVAAGSLMNFMLAVVLFSLVYFFFLGIPQTETTEIGQVLPEGQAYEAGLVEGDKVLAINGEDMADWESVVAKINANPETEITLLIERDGQEKTTSVVPENEEGRGLIGIAPVTEKYAFFSSIYLGLSNTWFFVQLIFVSLFQMIVGAIPADVAGPVGIVAVVGEVMETGFSNLLTLAGIISVNLGLINLLPIPALDGSRLVFLLLEAVRGKPIDPQKEGFIHLVGFTLLILLMIFIAFQDVTRFFL